MLKYYFYIFRNLFLKREFLLEKIKSHLTSHNAYHLSYFFSGRVALKKIIEEISGGKSYISNIFLPDYICNVVYKAIASKKLKTYHYETNSDLEPNIIDIKDKIQQGTINILMLASIFGSGKAIDYFVSHEGINLIEKHNVILLLDLCQDLTLAKKIPFSKNIAMVFSFNNKTVPGMMGGSILYYKVTNTKKELLGSQKCLLLIKRFVKTHIIKTRFSFKYFDLSAIKKNENFHYSYCQKFPYQFIDYYPSKFQISLSLSGLDVLPLFLSRKRNFIKKHCSSLKLLRYSTSSTYVIGQYLLRGVKVKKSYAVEGTPKKSLKPNLKILYNKGY